LPLYSQISGFYVIFGTVLLTTYLDQSVYWRKMCKTGDV